MRLKSAVCFCLGLVLLVCGKANAGVNDKVLKGSFAISGRGFTPDSFSDIGELGINGVITLNGTGGITGGDLTVTGGDNNATGFAPDQFICTAPTGVTGSYSVGADFTGTLTIDFPVAGTQCRGADGAVNGASIASTPFDVAFIEFTIVVFKGPPVAVKLVAADASDDIFDAAGDLFLDPIVAASMSPVTPTPVKLSDLKATWVLEADGFTVDGSASETGKLGIIGVIKVNGLGIITSGDVTYTGVDSVNDQIDCDSVVVTGTIQINPDKTGSFTINAPGGLACDKGNVSDSSVTFTYALEGTLLTSPNVSGTPSPEPILSTFFNTGLVDSGGDTVTNMVLTGTIQKQPGT